MSMRSLLLALVVFLAPVPRALAETSVHRDYEMTSWNDQDGLFASFILVMAQDSLGYLWLGTEHGLIRFDGVRFVPFDTPDRPSFPWRGIANLYAAKDDTLWVGFTQGSGISRVRHGIVRHYGEHDGFRGGRVTGIVEDRDRTLWVATLHGVYRFVNDRWEEMGLRYGLPEDGAATLYLSRTQTLWVGTSVGTFRWEPVEDRFRVIDESFRHLATFSEAPDGSIWATDPDTGFRQLSYTRQVPSSHRMPLKGLGHALLHDRFGNLWVGTLGKGLWFVPPNPNRRGAGIEVMNRHKGLSNDAVRSLLEDREGNVWVGTSAGLSKFSLRRLTPLTDFGVVRALATGLDGSIWVGTDDGLARFVENHRVVYGTHDGLPSANIQALHVDAKGVLWVATASGVARFIHGRFVVLPLITGVWPNRIISIATDMSGTLWMAAQDHGLVRWDHGDVEAFSPSSEVSHTSIDFMTIDREGQIWLVVAGQGIGVLGRDGRFRLLRARDDFHPTLTVYEDSTRAIWFGGDALSRFKAGRWATVTRQSGLPTGMISAITEDQDGYLWVGIGSGLARLTQSDFNRTAADPTFRLRLTFYPSSEGMAGASSRLGHPSVVRGPDGRLWFVTANGVTIVDPDRMSISPPAPPVRVEGIEADGRSYDPVSPISLPQRTTNLQIDYTALTFLAPRKVQFRYQLQGFDRGWIDAGSRRQAFYTNLPPGPYRFRVAARNAEGSWNEDEAAVDLAIKPTFYQTGWFPVFCGLVLCVALYGGWRLRIRRMRHQFSLVVAERVRLSREIHDTLLQSLVGVALQLNSVADTLGSSSQLESDRLKRMRRQVEEYIREARQSIWDLRSPALESGGLVAALRTAVTAAVDGQQIDLRFEVNGRPAFHGRNLEGEQQVLRIAQEAMRNAVRHSRARRIRVELRYQIDSMRLTISDDGCGFVPNGALTARNHYGLLMMQERAAQAGGQFRITTQLGQGTEIEVVIPSSSEVAEHLVESHPSVVRG